MQIIPFGKAVCSNRSSSLLSVEGDEQELLDWQAHKENTFLFLCALASVNLCYLR